MEWLEHSEPSMQPAVNKLVIGWGHFLLIHLLKYFIKQAMPLPAAAKDFPIIT